jgi:hypothetical protein
LDGAWVAFWGKLILPVHVILVLDGWMGGHSHQSSDGQAVEDCLELCQGLCRVGSVAWHDCSWLCCWPFHMLWHWRQPYLDFVDELVGKIDLSPNFAGVLVHIMSKGRATCALNFTAE